MALKYIELEDGRVRDVNSVEQMYQIDVKVSDEPPKRTQYWAGIKQMQFTAKRLRIRT